MEFNKALIEDQRNLIETLSKIELTGDKEADEKKAEKYLEINNNNKGGIVSFWLKAKKEKFSDFILKQIIIDINLPIYYNKKINLSLETLNSFNKICSEMEEQWITKIKDNFLLEILNEKASSKIRYINGESIFLKFYNQSFERKLIEVLIENFSLIIYIILNNGINNKNTRFISFDFIRRMSDLILGEKISGLSTNIYFKKRMSKVFSNSRRLIHNLFAFEFIKGLELFQIQNIPNGPFQIEKNIFEYKYNDNKIIIRFEPKETGINLGFILNIKKIGQSNEQEKIINSFYVKKYYGSTNESSKNFNKNESITFSISSAIKFTASLRSTETKSEWKKRKFDLKEPFLYILLNSLNIVPEVKFFINPYVLDGFYIITKNISDEENIFLPLSKMENKIIKDNYDFIKKSLNLIDFISRITRLRDLHNNNFGFIIDRNTKIFKSLTIIDFAQPIFMELYEVSSKEIIKQFLNCTYSGQKNEGIRILNLDDCDIDEVNKYIKNTFLKVEEKLRILNGFNALEQFKKIIETVELKQINNSEIKCKSSSDKEPDDSLDEKFRNILKISSENIKNLMLQKRGNKNDPEENILKDPLTNLPRTNAELIGFKIGKAPDNIGSSERIIDYLNHYKDMEPKEVPKPFPEETDETFFKSILNDEWTFEYLQKFNLDNLFNLINSAEYLKIDGLVSLLSAKVAYEMCNCSIDDARNKFGIESDMTEEEVAEFDKYPLD